MTVEEMFSEEKIDKDFIREKMCGESSYWDSAFKFIKENWTRNVDTLSPKQSAWLSRILDDCVDVRIKAGQ
jgi:hypothetical protein